MHFGNTVHTIIVPSGNSRSVYYSAGVRDSLVSLVRSSSEFTFLTSVRQMRHNSGSLLSLRHSDSRQMLEIQSSGRQDVLRLLYMTGAGLRVETFPLRLADDSWHRLAVIVSGDQIEVTTENVVITEVTLVLSGAAGLQICPHKSRDQARHQLPARPGGADGLAGPEEPG